MTDERSIKELLEQIDHDYVRDARLSLRHVMAIRALVEVYEAARALHEQVEMDESVGVCLSDRVASLRLGAALAKFEKGGE